MTRLWLQRNNITVICTADGLPQSFTWRGQQYQVDYIAKQWRIDVEWWRNRVWRDCYKLSTVDGLLVVIYHDLLSEAWYLQRLYD